MGLDMFLFRMPRYKNATAKDVQNVEEYFSWASESTNAESEYRNCTLKEWCGLDEKDLNKEYIDFYIPYYHKCYGEFDTEHKYPYWSVKEEVGYWRKANAVHNWFVDNIQDGEDDCDFHREVTKEGIQNLLDCCNKVLDTMVVKEGTVSNGQKYENGKWVDIEEEEGIQILNTEEIKNILPCVDGFFFGATAYNNYYIDRIKYTKEVCENLLKTTDFETQMIYYCSSW